MTFFLHYLQGLSILRVGARDGDVGDPRTVRIEIENDHLGHFRLVPVEVQNNNRDDNYLISYYDIVTTDIPLDREHADVLQNGGIYTFTVKVILDFFACIFILKLVEHRPFTDIS